MNRFTLFFYGDYLEMIEWEYNEKIEVSKIDVKSYEFPEAFDGCRILQVSDLHGNIFWEQQSKLIEISKRTRPDYIFITGDLIDEHCKDLEMVYSYI